MCDIPPPFTNWSDQIKANKGLSLPQGKESPLLAAGSSEIGRRCLRESVPGWTRS